MSTDTQDSREVVEIVARASCGTNCDAPRCSIQPTKRDKATCVRLSREAAARVLTAIEASGWKIVPVEPSERMLEAGAYNEWENHDESSASIVWRLMLSASPKVTR